MRDSRERQHFLVIMENTMKHTSLLERLFKKNFRLVDGTDEIFELDLALWEYESLTKKELIDRSAYFQLVDGVETVHFRTCKLQNLEEVHKDSSFRTKIFFLSGRYSTGYATHSLFPYRGKFHPQLIRALLNILQVKPGDVVLDPMAGSSTVAVEANLLGINAIAVDLSPLCKLMGEVKTFALDLDSSVLESIASNPQKILSGLQKAKVPGYFLNGKNAKAKKYYEVVLLAFLDAMGFAHRSEASIGDLFPRVLERYILTIKYFQKARKEMNLAIGKTTAIQGSALDLPVADGSVDAIITSPPYSFAIDYLKNDQPQLEYLGCDLESIRENMVGLQGRGVENKLEIYFDKMDRVIGEMKRVAKKKAPIVIIIGTNDIQTKGVNLQENVIALAEGRKLDFVCEIQKPIRGLQNTMKNESILMFNKTE